MGGVLKGVSAVFFAYIGFDAISTTAEECRNPQRDLPRGMLYALIICTIIYVVTALVITGMVHYSKFENITDPLAFVFEQINMKEIGFIISVSAVIAATSVLLVFQLGQPRIWMSMSRDGLLPGRFGRIDSKYRTPGFATVISGLLVGGLVLFVDDKLVTDLTSIGTLFAFVLVSGGVLMLPRLPKREGKFSLPYVNSRWIVPLLYVGFIWLFRDRAQQSLMNWNSENYQEMMFLLFLFLSGILTVASFLRNFSLIPVLGVLCCMYLMIEIPAKSWVVFFGWMGLGLILYFVYGLKHSRLAQHEG
jgi:amino acid transporter